MATTDGLLSIPVCLRETMQYYQCVLIGNEVRDNQILLGSLDAQDTCIPRSPLTCGCIRNKSVEERPWLGL
jgi:hypothetical protein